MSPAFRILVVEGEPYLHERLRRLLKTPGHDLHRVPSGKTAAAFLEHHRVDLVVIHALNPGARAEGLVERLKRRCGDAVIIVISDHPPAETERGTPRRGAHDYLTRPVDDEKLLRRVQNALSLKKLTDERNEARQALRLERQQLISTFDSVEHPVYVSALDSCEVLYANHVLRNRFGPVLGKKCYRIFHGNDSPCPFCISGHILERHGRTPHISEFQDRLNGRRYQCINGIVHWSEGRKARYRMAIEITGRKETERALRQSEARYRELVQNANSIIFRRDPTGKVTFFNEFAQDFFGYTEDEIVGRNVVGTIVPETDSAGRNLAEMIADIGLRPHDYSSNQNENTKKNGERVWIAWTNKAIFDKDGNISEILCVGNDITERKRAERALRESEERFREMAALLPTIICEMDTDLRVTYANKIGLETFGFSEDDLKAGINAADLIHPDERGKAVNRLEQIALGTKMTATEYRLLRKDRSEIRALVNSSPVADNGKIVGLRTSITDITEQKKLERQLQQAQKMEAIGTLAGGIAHDFNNLLMGIQGNVSLMLMDLDPGHAHFERLNKVEGRIRTGTKLTTHLLGYARKGKYELKPIDLNTVVKESCEALGRTRKDITVVTNLAGDLTPIEADPGQIEQVFMNLYVNAADAMPGGGKLILETMNTTHETMEGKLYTPEPGNYVMLAVTDTGTGMDAETVERIFEGDYAYFCQTGDGIGDPMPIYIVAFDPTEIWGARAESGPLSLYAELFEAYLEPMEES